MNLEKNIWTEQDFESMGWHDSKIYGIAFEEKSEFVLDIDYIFKWLKPTEDQQAFKFWVCPCTLVFENVYNLNLEIEMSEPFEIQISDVSRNNPHRPKNADIIHRDIEYDWKMETNNGEISFTSIGYKQYVRELPKLLDSQTIGKEDRNGISFERIKK